MKTETHKLVANYYYFEFLFCGTWDLFRNGITIGKRH